MFAVGRQWTLAGDRAVIATIDVVLAFLARATEHDAVPTTIRTCNVAITHFEAPNLSFASVTNVTKQVIQQAGKLLILWWT
jgi:hypothetical protein